MRHAAASSSGPITPLHPAKSAGIPWMAILGADGKTLVTSDAPKTGNVG
ncbi:MAG TPA: hypothetical protein VHX68_13360 [Planctomycetaceae bacterium]|nr:hypothetical protein [Planctomycetaceae bacterium]